MNVEKGLKKISFVCSHFPSTQRFTRERVRDVHVNYNNNKKL